MKLFDTSAKVPPSGILAKIHIYEQKQVNPNINLSIMNGYSNHSEHVAYQKLPLNRAMPLPNG